MTLTLNIICFLEWSELEFPKQLLAKTFWQLTCKNRLILEFDFLPIVRVMQPEVFFHKMMHLDIGNSLEHFKSWGVIWILPLLYATFTSQEDVHFSSGNCRFYCYPLLSVS